MENKENISKSPVAEVLEEMAQLAQQKYEQYGNTYYDAGEILSTLSRNEALCVYGSTGHALYSVLAWMVGKLCRYFRAQTHEAKLDSLKDLAVYAAMAYMIYKNNYTLNKNTGEETSCTQK